MSDERLSPAELEALNEVLPKIHENSPGVGTRWFQRLLSEIKLLRVERGYMEGEIKALANHAAELKRERDEYKQSLLKQSALLHSLDGVEAERDSLRAQVAALEADKEKLIQWAKGPVKEHNERMLGALVDEVERAARAAEPSPPETK